MNKYHVKINRTVTYECYVEAEDEEAVENILDYVNYDDCLLWDSTDEDYDIAKVYEAPYKIPLLIQTEDGYDVKK